MQFPPACRSVTVEDKEITIVSEMVDLYREKVNNNVMLVSWDLAGYGVGNVVRLPSLSQGVGTTNPCLWVVGVA